MTRDALLCNTRECTKSAGQVAVNRSLLSDYRKLACSTMHLHADLSHRLWHIRRHVRSAVSGQRRHPNSVFSHLGGTIESTSRKSVLYFGDGQEMVTHVAQHVSSHYIGKFHVLSRLDGVLSSRMGANPRPDEGED